MDYEHWFKHQAFDDKACFLCGLKTSDITKEHVIPKWLLKKYDLWDKRLILLNNTKIPYRLLTVPCCATCNNGALSSLELKVQNALSKGYASCIKVNPDYWYLWVAKIFYGILRKEIMLKKERSSRSPETIIEPELLKSFHSIHLFLQQIRGEHTFSKTRPYSLFLANIYEQPNDEYFMMDSLEGATVLLRIGDVGIILALQDAEISFEKYGWYLEEVNGNKLHSIQLHELYAYVTYSVRLMSHTPTHYTFTVPPNSEKTNKFTTITSYNGTFADWKRDEFVGCLWTALKEWVEKPEDLVIDDNHIKTWMAGENSKPLLFSKEGWEKFINPSV